MKIRIFERSGEIGKIGEYLNYEFIIDSGSTGFLEQFFKEREQALKKYLKMKEKIIKEIFLR